MDLKEINGVKDTYSSGASNISRQLSFSGIAIVWLIIMGQKLPTEKMPLTPTLPLLLFAMALLFDLLQYVYGWGAWAFYYRYKEKRMVDRDQKFLAPIWINWPTIAFFIGKILMVGVGYAVLIKFLFDIFTKSIMGGLHV